MYNEKSACVPVRPEEKSTHRGSEGDQKVREVSDSGCGCGCGCAWQSLPLFPDGVDNCVW
jgi:hypothetical protein